MDLVATFFLNFSDYRIGLFSLADIALMILIVFSVRFLYRIQITKKMTICTGLMLLGAIGSLFLNLFKEYFSVAEYMASFVKLLFYTAAVFLIPTYLVSRKINVIKIVRIFMYIAVIGAVLQLVLIHFLGVESWPLYSLGSNLFGIKTPNSMVVGNGSDLIRARSFFTEPAAFVVGITLAFLLLLYEGSEKFNWKDSIFYITGILVANSVSGYGMAMLIYIIYFFHIKNYKKFIRMMRLIVPCTIVIAVVLVFNGYLRGRLINFFALKDMSGVVRIIGGFHFLGEIPPYGVGLGNQSLYYHSLNLDIAEQMWYSGSGEFYNIILVSIITMGYIGTIGFLLFQYYSLRKDKRIFTSLLVTHFATGRLYAPSLWVFLILYLTASMRGRRYPLE